MTERKPAHESVPDFVERQIREAQARGDFDGLSGHGQPLEDLGRPDDELWWIRRKLRDEELVDLPPALLARRTRDEAVADVAVAPHEEAVRRIVEQANRVIRHINRTTISGPPTATMPLDVEEVLAAWRRTRPAPVEVREPMPGEESSRDDGGSRWWSALRLWLRAGRGGHG